MAKWLFQMQWLLLPKVAVAERGWEILLSLPSRTSRADSHQPGWRNSRPMPRPGDCMLESRESYKEQKAQAQPQLHTAYPEE